MTSSMKINTCQVLSLYFSINDLVQIKMTMTFSQKQSILRKIDLAFHKVKEELWNLWDVLLEVLESLEYYFFSKCAEVG